MGQMRAYGVWHHKKNVGEGKKFGGPIAPCPPFFRHQWLNTGPISLILSVCSDKYGLRSKIAKLSFNADDSLEDTKGHWLVLIWKLCESCAMILTTSPNPNLAENQKEMNEVKSFRLRLKFFIHPAKLLRLGISITKSTEAVLDTYAGPDHSWLFFLIYHPSYLVTSMSTFFEGLPPYNWNEIRKYRTV